jgi:hypothetical protein
MIKWLKQLFCRHAIYLDDMERDATDHVRVDCFKCGKSFRETHGLIFGHYATFHHRKNE